MAQLRANEIRSALLRLGFIEKTKSDHARYTLQVNGLKRRVGTMISHGEREIHDGLVSLMARQLHVSSKEFVGLVDGSLGADWYYESLRQKGLMAREDK